MRVQMLSVVLLLAVTVMTSTTAADQRDQDRVAEAKELFARYTAFEQAFDPAIAELYSDQAEIWNRRTYPTGQTREMTMPAPQYKALMRTAMPLAKARGDVSTYSEVTYALEGGGVRIKADRFSELKKYHSPLSILVRLSASGRWLIYEELSESQP